MMDKEDKIQHIFAIIPTNWNDKIDMYQKVIDEIKLQSSVCYLDDNPFIIKSFFNECNALVFEKSLELLFNYIEISDFGKKNLKSECLVILEKCFQKTRAHTKKLGIDILILLHESFKSDITEILLSQFSNSKPNIVNGVLETLIKMISQVKHFPVREVVKKLSVVLESRDQMSRTMAKKLAIEICTSFGRNKIEPFLKDLKPIFLNELTIEFDKVVENIILNQSDEESKPVVDLLSKISHGNIFENIDGGRLERIEALEKILEIIDESPLANGNYRELVRKLCHVMTKDSQIPAVVLSIKILHQIANGLKKNFATYSNLVIEACLEKFKEKKPVVLSATRDCIDAAFMSTNFDACSDCVVKSMENKNPTVRIETTGFLLRIIKKCPGNSPLKKSLKVLMPILRKLCDDMDSKVREHVFQLIGEFIGIVGQKSINPFLENLDSTKLQLIKSCTPQTSNNPPKETKTVVVAQPPKTVPTKEVVSEPIKKPVKQMKEVLINECELEDLYLQFLDKDVLNKMSSQVWKNRLESCDSILHFLNRSEIDRRKCQILTHLLLRKPGLRDSNIAVVKKKLKILQDTFKKCENGISMLIVDICLEEILEKVGDVKLGAVAKESLSTICSKIENNGLVIVHCLQKLLENKSVRSVTESIDWIIEYVSANKSKNLPIKDVLPLIRQLLLLSNISVRQLLITLIGLLYKDHGKIVVNYYEAEKSVIVEAIMKETAKIDKVMKEEKSKLRKEKKNEEESANKIIMNEKIQDDIPNAMESNFNSNSCATQNKEIFPESESCLTTNYDGEIHDNCRSFALDMCNKLIFYTNQHSDSLFHRELGLFLSSMKEICDPNMKRSIDLLVRTFNENWKETEEVSIQTDLMEKSPEKVKEKPLTEAFINVRKHTRGLKTNEFDQENIDPLKTKENNINVECLQLTKEKNNSNAHVNLIKEIIHVLENENSHFIVYENLSKLKRLFKDTNRRYISDYIFDLILVLLKRSTVVMEISLSSSVQEIQQIITIISTIYSEPKFRLLLTKEPILSELYQQLFLILVNQNFQSLELFVGLRKSISVLISEITDHIPSTDGLCSMVNLLHRSLRDLGAYQETQYLNVVMKSTFKFLEKTKKESPSELNLTKILSVLNQPFHNFSQDENKVNNMAFKALKTVVDCLTKFSKSQMLECVPKDNNEQLIKYIFRCLERIKSN